MKLSAEHFNAMRDAIKQLDVEQTRKAYRDGNFQRAELCKDVNKRYRWDLFWAAMQSYPNSIRPILDAGYKDAHIDTALRRIVPDVKEEVA